LYVHTGIQTNHLKELWVSEQVFDDQQELASFRLGGGE
jgi:carbohydrate-selective porin OprB